MQSAAFRLVLVVLYVGLACSIAAADAEARRARPPSSDGVQLTAAGHVLSFDSGGFRAAGGDHLLRVDLVGGSSAAPVPDGSSHRKGIQAPPLERVSYLDRWPGIDVRYESATGGILQSSYLLRPGAEVDRIRLRYNAGVTVDADGGLRIRYGAGEMRESRPVAWQEIEGRRTPVEVSFRLIDAPASEPVTPRHLVGFSLGDYDRSRAVMIDPVLQWNTFMGSENDDVGTAIAVDGSGNVYVAGYSGSDWGMPVHIWNGAVDGFVAKLDASGALSWHTFLGGASNDEAHGIGLDPNGDVYVVGTSYDTWGTPVAAFTAGTNAFAAKLDGESGVLQWNTFMGGPEHIAGLDQGLAIAVDASSHVYAVGVSSSNWGSPVNAYSDGLDTFVCELDGNGVRQWTTFMGSSMDDWGRGVAVDGAGHVYVAGQSDATWGTPVAAHSGSFDAFAAELDGSGVLQWNTFMGSPNVDWGRAIAVDGPGNVYVTGFSVFTWGRRSMPMRVEATRSSSSWTAAALSSGAPSSARRAPTRATASRWTRPVTSTSPGTATGRGGRPRRHMWGSPTPSRPSSTRAAPWRGTPSWAPAPSRPAARSRWTDPETSTSPATALPRGARP
jgi:hypothetical protein